VDDLPTILVAGGSNLYVQLLDPFPPTLCNIVYAETAAEAADQAVLATLVVVDAKLRGGGVDLCRRLRSEPITSHIPLVLRVYSDSDAMQALTDARVKAADFHGLVKTIRRLCPDLASAAQPPVPTDDHSLGFDDEIRTVIYRRSASEDENDWPPPPPVQGPRQDLVDFAQDYAGYINSLIEALEAPTSLPGAQVSRLHEMSTLTTSSADAILDAVQAAINDALKQQDLARMKVLSSAKNSLFEKLQRVRSLAGRLDSVSQKAAPRSRPETAQAETGLPQKKSELTRAAEAKKKAALAAEKAVRAEQRSHAAKTKPVVTGTGSARRDESSTALPLWMWASFAVVAVAVAAYVIVRYAREPALVTAAPTGNVAPVMKFVLLEQSPIGVQVRPQAEDKNGDRISFMIRWLVNGTLVETERTTRLSNRSYQDGDRIQAEVIPSDGRLNGELMRSPELVAKPITPGIPVPKPDAGAPPPAPATPPAAPAPSAPAAP
jgi:CheY-like chemotaxis protein